MPRAFHQPYTPSVVTGTRWLIVSERNTEPGQALDWWGELELVVRRPPAH
jgi:hypothetical protein